jgi:hypothetical protein
MKKSDLKSTKMNKLELNPFLFVSEKAASNQLIRKIFHKIFFSYDQGWENGKLVSSKGSGTLGDDGNKTKGH